MGSPDADDMAYYDERPQHEVTVSGFRIALTPVTASVYAEVMQRKAPPEDQKRLSAVDVTWHDAITFCNRLSEREDYRPCYHRKFGRDLSAWL